MTSPSDLVDHLAHIVRKDPRGGGARRHGMKILQRGSGRKVPDDWPKDSTVPTEVAEILLGIQFDGKKAVASCFEAAEAVSQHFGWRLTWKEDFQLGGYLLSCLIKAEYYRLYNILRSAYRFEFSLVARKKEILEYPESNPYTSDKPFPAWTSGVDDQGRTLVKPSFPQLKKTVWEPSESEFRISDPPPGIMEGFRIKQGFAKDHVDIWQADSDDMATMRGVGIHAWVRGVNKLESNAYRINQKLLNVLNEVGDDKRKAPKEKDRRLIKEQEVLEKERSTRKRGDAIGSDGNVQFQWADLPLKNRTIDYLNHLWSQQKEQDRKRKKRGLRPLPDEDKRRHLTKARKLVRKEYWHRWYENAKAQELLKIRHKDFYKTIKRANQLGDKPFYQRCHLDYRGRVYLSKSKLNYQADDLQRGLIEFAEGKKPRKGDMKYLWIHLANTFGMKGTADDLEKQAKKKEKEFIKWGKYPVKWYSEWSKQADDKWQFIRTCMELVELKENPNYKSTLIVEVDQSTSCLQHIALIMGDTKLACDVNLCDEYHDVYQEIADGTSELLRAKLTAGERRKLIKLALMPWTYGGDAWSACQDYHKSEMKFLKDMTASQRLSFAHRMINRIIQALPTAERYTENWQQLVDARFDNTTYRNSVWETPSEFTVYCYKQQEDERRVRVWAGKSKNESKRDDEKRLTAWEPNNRPDQDAIKTAFPPNFVHSIDASVMHLVLASTPRNQAVVGVHDALGTHIRHAGDVRERFRNTLHRIYAFQHPRLTVVEGIPPEVAWPDNDDEKKIIAGIRTAPHLIN